MITQLKKLLNRKDYRKNLTYRVNRQKENENNIEDIYDGLIFKELSEEGEILSDPNSIPLQWYTDEIAVFKSSKFSIWPFYLINFYLDPREQYKAKNLILAGMWFKDKKPIPNLFLTPMVDELRKLYEGVEVNNTLYRTVLMSGTADSPALSLFFNFKQYNANFGCRKCKQRGEKDSNRWVYPYRKFKMRSDEETLVHAKRANEIKKPVFGVKGSSALSLFVYKPIRSTGIDIMHLGFSGFSAHQMISLCFNSKFSDEPYSLYHVINIVDSQLTSFRPPSFVQRKFRSIKDHLSYWKASESKNWFCYASLVKTKLSLER